VSAAEFTLTYEQFWEGARHPHGRRVSAAAEVAHLDIAAGASPLREKIMTFLVLAALVLTCVALVALFVVLVVRV